MGMSATEADIVRHDKKKDRLAAVSPKFDFVF
jgi:hypothetical protein